MAKNYKRRSLLLKAVLIAAASAASASPLVGQTSNPGPHGARLAYEVVSVKPSKPGCRGMSVSSPPGRFSAHCTTLLGLLFNAYPIKPHVPVPGLPGWGTSARFDVEAKADDRTALAMQKLSGKDERAQAQLMLQALLADRFQLRIHHETRERPIYDLVVAKGGSKLKDAPESERSRGYSWGRGRIQVGKGPVGSLAFSLSDMVGREVVDKTGLTGKYDIDLRWTPYDQQGTPDAGPTLFTALEEQLGLKLVPAKGSVDTIVVDHVEKPSPN